MFELDLFKFKSKYLGIVWELVCTMGWKLQLADAFPWACGEPTSSLVQRCAPNASLLLAKAVLRYGSRSLLVVSPDQADPSGVAANFRFHPTFIVEVLISFTVSSM
ncbi:hypothetical protein SporoP32a_13225 [Sporosarcina ureae]|nr:hypothetical protein SporoP32a_13225 [Sporosarcina ureae]